jgi:hypothetical protein
LGVDEGFSSNDVAFFSRDILLYAPILFVHQSKRDRHCNADINKDAYMHTIDAQHAAIPYMGPDVNVMPSALHALKIGIMAKQHQTIRDETPLLKPLSGPVAHIAMSQNDVGNASMESIILV